MLPNFLIIGAPRCGTTWIQNNLALHPEVYAPSTKELHFFDRHYDNGIDWYEQQFAGADAPVVGEATPAYLYPEEVPCRIKRHIPDAKLIVSLRDPVERAHSHFCYRLPEQRAQGLTLSFEQKLEQSPRLVAESRYAAPLQRYLDLFPRENVLVVLHQDIARRPEALLVDLYAFLGIDVRFRSPLCENKINMSASRAGRSSLAYKLSRGLKKYGLPRLSSALDRLNRRELPGVDATTREKLLYTYFRADIEDVERLTGRNLAGWKV